MRNFLAETIAALFDNAMLLHFIHISPDNPAEPDNKLQTAALAHGLGGLALELLKSVPHLDQMWHPYTDIHGHIRHCARMDTVPDFAALDARNLQDFEAAQVEKHTVIFVERDTSLLGRRRWQRNFEAWLDAYAKKTKDGGHTTIITYQAPSRYRSAPTVLKTVGSLINRNPSFVHIETGSYFYEVMKLTPDISGVYFMGGEIRKRRDELVGMLEAKIGLAGRNWGDPRFVTAAFDRASPFAPRRPLDSKGGVVVRLRPLGQGASKNGCGE